MQSQIENQQPLQRFTIELHKRTQETAKSGLLYSYVDYIAEEPEIFCWKRRKLLLCLG